MLQAVREGLGKVLEAVGTATAVIGLVQQHHTKVIQPQVEASTGEAAACSSGLAAVIKTTEERVLTSLQAALNAILAQVMHARPWSSLNGSAECTPCTSDAHNLSASPSGFFVLLHLASAHCFLLLNSVKRGHYYVLDVNSHHCICILDKLVWTDNELPLSLTLLLSKQVGRLFCISLQCLSAVQMDRTLTSEQKRIDFRPPEDLPPPLDRPTDACLFATTLLSAAAKAVQDTLQGSNGSAFVSEVSHDHNLSSCYCMLEVFHHVQCYGLCHGNCTAQAAAAIRHSGIAKQ